MSDIRDLQTRIDERFRDAFGHTPISQRLKDIRDEAIELAHYRDITNLREEFGDLLCSVLAGISESGFDAERLIAATLEKIARRRAQYKALGRKVRCAILGGAFDPVHNGHIELAQFVLDAGQFDELWLMPCWKHLFGKKMANWS